TQTRLREILPPNASVRNPIDVAGGTDSNPAIFADCAKILLEDKAIGGLLIVGLFGGYAIRFADVLRFMEEDAAHRMGKLIKKPIVLHSLYNFARPHSLELMRYYNIPVYDSLEIACKSIEVLSRHGHFLETYPSSTNFVLNSNQKAKKEAQKIIAHAYAENRTLLLEHEAKKLLALHKAPVTVDELARNGAEAKEIAKRMKQLVAMKVISPDIIHKSDAGGVLLNLNENTVEDAFKTILDNAQQYNKNADIQGCLICPMISKGIEMIIGTKNDPQFGPIIMFGLGGIFVEVMKDVVFRVIPLNQQTASTMITEIKAYPVINGGRGSLVVDKEKLTSILMTVSDIIEAYPEIAEMDLNPIIAHEQGISIVDARIILNKKN
ncbi:acetate--CoA ligase family protein, partial [candidate division CSSED10-310 bacterium]